ncbi:MAG TPA: hypothetical protein DCQ06_07085 [Myxococcales bacterium]|nr:hypothetical protein [Myxococcales bacterium]HAN31344.1 hypothetical protein [Myxococcales bacterium]
MKSNVPIHPEEQSLDPANRGRNRLLLGVIAGLVCGGLGFVLWSSGSYTGDVSPRASLTSDVLGKGTVQPKGVERRLLQAALDANNEPSTPADCVASDSVQVTKLIEALGLMSGGKARSQRNKDKRALKLLVAHKEPRSPEFLAIFARAKLLAGASDPDVTTTAHRARQLCPKLALAWETEAAVHLLGQRPKIALGLLREAVRLAPDFPRADKELAMALTATGGAVEALQVLTRLERRHPKIGELDILKAQALLAQGKSSDALSLLEKASTASPKDPVLWYLLGITRRLVGDKAGAHNAYCKAAALGHGRAARKCPDAAGMPIFK